MQNKSLFSPFHLLEGALMRCFSIEQFESNHVLDLPFSNLNSIRSLQPLKTSFILYSLLDFGPG